MCRFMNTQSAAFYLRTAPLIDKNFKLKYNNNQTEVRSSREIELGIRKYDKLHDGADLFDDSDHLRPSQGAPNATFGRKIHDE